MGLSEISEARIEEQDDEEQRQRDASEADDGRGEAMYGAASALQFPHPMICATNSFAAPPL